MNATTLKAVGEALWGPQFIAEMSRQLGVARKTVTRWVAGEYAVPDVIKDRLRKLLVARQMHITRLLTKVG